MSVLGAAPGPSGMVTEPGQVQNSGPMLEDVIKHLEIPQVLPMQIPKPDTLRDAAMDQTASLSRIAQALENGVACQVQALGEAKWQAEMVERLVAWVQLFVGIAVFAPIVTAIAMFLLR